MAYVYNPAKQKILTPVAQGANATNTLSFSADAFRVVLLSSGYTASTAHALLTDVPSGAVRVATSANLTSTAVSSAGVFSADNVVFTNVTGSAITQAVLYKNASTEATSSLVIYYASGDITGFPVTPNGGDITLTWNASGIFSL